MLDQAIGHRQRRRQAETSRFEIGDELVPGYGSNYQQGRTSNNVYFSAILETGSVFS